MVPQRWLKPVPKASFKRTQRSGTYLVEPVVELLGAGLAAEVSCGASELSGDAFLAELVTVVTAYTFQTQPLDKILLKQQLTSWGKKRRETS